MPKVRVNLTMFPDRGVEVDEDEVPSLRAQGILIGVEGEKAEPAGSEDKTGTEGGKASDESAPDAAASKRGKGSPAQ
jgi:hypothetical protein